jgi:hypothetical protein
VNAHATVIDLARTLPRTRWYASDAVPVLLALAGAAAVALYLFGQAQQRVSWLIAADRRLEQRLEEIAPRALPAASELAHIQHAQAERDAIFAQRRSGLVLANLIDGQGRALAHDALATKLDSQGSLEGYAPSYAAVNRIWRRLGSASVLSSAEPAGGSVRFRIESAAPARPPAKSGAAAALP